MYYNAVRKLTTQSRLNSEKLHPVRACEVALYSIFLATNMREDSEKCSEIESLAVQGESVTGVTTMEAEACNDVVVIGGYKRGTAVAITQADFQDLTRYFSRPRVVIEGTLSTSRANQTYLAVQFNDMLTYKFPDGLFRLMGVFGLRCSIVFTLQIAATPFHQGVLAMSFQYEPDANKTYIRGAQPHSITNLPHVRLDLSESTMCQLKVPFMNSSEFMIKESTADYGIMHITSILPVAYAATGVPPTYRVLMHLEDIELYGAVAESLANVTLQSGKPMNKEFESDAYPFSSSLSSFSRAVSFLGKGIPALGSIAGPVAWFTSKAAGAVRSFGYAKPIIQEPPKKVFAVSNIQESHVDVASNSLTVGGFQGNQLRVHPSFAETEVDEMSLSYILGQWGQLFVGTLETTQATGSIVYAAACAPMNFWFRAPTATTDVGSLRAPELALTDTNSFFPTHILAVANCFRLYRGGFKFRFTFCKTKFHAGRVLVSFTPYYGDFNPSNSSTTVPVAASLTPITGQPFGYSKIFDLRDSNVMEFDVPYVSGTPYVRTFSSCGSLSVRVLDPLIAPDTVASTVPFLVEVKGADDLEFAVPRGPLYAPMPLGTVRLQSGAMLSTIKPEASELCVGEVVTSVKQLIQIPKWTKRSLLATAGTSYVQILPWYYQPIQNPVLPNTFSLKVGSLGLPGYWATHFLYARGGTEAHIYHDGTNVAARANTFATDFNSPGANKTVLNGSMSGLPSLVFSETDKGYHFRAPAHSQVVRIPTYQLNNLTYTAAGYASLASMVQNVYSSQFSLFYVLLKNDGARDMTFSVARAASDDAMLGHYLGPSPLYLPINADAGTYDPDYW